MPFSDEKIMKQAIDSTQEGICISHYDKEDMPIAFVNEGFEKMTGYSSDDCVGKNCRFLQGEETDKNTVTRINEALKNKQAITVELLNYRKDGTPFWNRLAMTPLYNEEGELKFYAGVQSDVSDYKMEHERLEKLNLMNKKTVYMLSHQLKDGITAINSLSSMLMDKAGDYPPEKIKSYAEQLKGASNLLDSKLEEILSFMRGETLEIESDIDLTKLKAEEIL